MKNKFLAWLFYTIFLRKTTKIMYDIVDCQGTREPTKIGYDFLKVYYHLMGYK